MSSQARWSGKASPAEAAAENKVGARAGESLVRLFGCSPALKITVPKAPWSAAA
jgi:hypothetical protein